MKNKMTRRLFLGSALGFGVMALFPVKAMADMVNFNVLKKKGANFPYTLTEQQWHDKLGPAYPIVRGGGNETAGTSNLVKERRKGVYLCRGCGTPLFSSSAKTMSNDFPTFRQPLDLKLIGTAADFSAVLPRTEVHCLNCGSHLGYKFSTDDNVVERWQYQLNGTSLAFRPS